MIKSDMMLVREYAAHNSEEAFATLVSRYVSLVHLAALRQVCDQNLAEEITQTVFIILAHKAGSLDSKTVLPSWLYRTANYVSGTALKIQRRREQREQKAYMQTMIQEAQTEVTWEQLAPVVGQGHGPVTGERPRCPGPAFFPKKELQRNGRLDRRGRTGGAEARGASAGKASRHFRQMGREFDLGDHCRSNFRPFSPSSATGVGPSGDGGRDGQGRDGNRFDVCPVIGSVENDCPDKSENGGSDWTGPAVGSATAATVTISYVETEAARRDLWRVPNFNYTLLDLTTPQMRILPTKFSGDVDSHWAVNDFGKLGGIKASVAEMAWIAYRFKPGRVLFPGGPPQAEYDFISTLAEGNEKALKQELENKLGFIGRIERRDVDVLALRVRNPAAGGLKPPIIGREDESWWTKGNYHCSNQNLSSLAAALESYLKQPVLDETGLREHYQMELKWKEQGDADLNRDEIMKSLEDQLGLELVPGHQTIEMLVMEKAK